MREGLFAIGGVKAPILKYLLVITIGPGRELGWGLASQGDAGPHSVGLALVKMSRFPPYKTRYSRKAERTVTRIFPLWTIVRRN